MNKLKQFIRSLNIADYFSLARVALAPVLVIVLLSGSKFAFAVMLAIAFLTDTIDGRLARYLKISSQRGAKLDSIGDGIIAIIALFSLLFYEYNFFIHHLFFIITPFLLYCTEGIIALIKFQKLTFYHTYLEKIAFTIQAIFLLIVLLFGINLEIFFVIWTITIVNLIEKIIMTSIIKTYSTDLKGLYWLLQKKLHKN